MSLLPSLPQALALCAVITLSACSGATPSEPPQGDYRNRHPIVVVKQPYSMVLDLPAADKDLAPIDQARVEEFVDRYIKRGEGAVVVSVAGKQDDDAARAKALRIGQLLIDAGLYDSEIDVRIAEGGGKGDAALLGFDGYSVDVPECGKFNEGSEFTPSNLPSENYGCSIQRNVGLMVSNPRDLIQARTRQGRLAARANDVLTKYKIGEDTRSKTPVSGAVATQSQGQTKQ